MSRNEWIEVGARALYGEGEEGPSLEAEQRREGCRSLAEDILDAVMPLIVTEVQAMRAEAREALKHARHGEELIAATVGIAVLDDVLAVLDWGSDE